MINKDMVRYAKENGIVHKKPQLIKDKDGETREIEIFSHYEQNDKNEYRIIFLDHISLIGVEQGMDLRQSMNKLSAEYFVQLRNKWNFIPVVIQQQAMNGESLDNFKNNKLRPSLSELGDSKNIARDMNMLIGIFSPYRHELRNYLAYDITRLRDNIRFVEIMINRDEQANDVAALYFDGAVNYFKEMPQANDSSAMEGVYGLIENNRKRSIVLTMLSINNLKKTKNIWINLLKRCIS